MLFSKNREPVLLFAPPDFWGASNEQKARICNACGPKGFGLLVPDTIYGLYIGDACDIHDWMYEYSKPLEEEKNKADRVFRNNLFRIVKQCTKFSILLKLRLRRAEIYYDSVCRFGHDAFWTNKNKPEEMGRVAK